MYHGFSNRCTTRQTDSTVGVHELHFVSTTYTSSSFSVALIWPSRFDWALKNNYLSIYLLLLPPPPLPPPPLMTIRQAFDHYCHLSSACWVLLWIRSPPNSAMDYMSRSLTCVRDHSYACMYTQGLGTPRLRCQHNIFDSEKLISVFLVLQMAFELGWWNAESDVLPIEAPRYSKYPFGQSAVRRFRARQPGSE